MSKNSKAHYSTALKEFQTLKGSHNLEYYYDGLDGLMEDHARNRFYDEIKRQVDAGTITIEAAS